MKMDKCFQLQGQPYQGLCLWAHVIGSRSVFAMVYPPLWQILDPPVHINSVKILQNGIVD